MIPLAINLMPDAPVGELIELARLAEAVGCTRCWVNDEGLTTRDVYVTLAALAGHTESIRLGPGITNPHVRHPAATASAIATLDELSGGRGFLGLGAGGGLTLRPLGIEPQRPVAAVRETVTAVRRLFAGETVNHNGEFALRSARLAYGRPDIEILLAGRGPRMMALAGQVADGFNLGYIHRDLLGSAVAALRADRPAEAPFLVTYTTLIVTTDAEFEEARSQLTFRLVDSPSEVKDRLGLTPDDETAIRAALAQGGPAAAAPLVKDDWVPPFVITGSASEAAAELHRRMSAHAIDEFQLPVVGSAGAAEAIERAATLFTR